jgi:methylmalonyl-CoA/ethylmalonyl-CoA epimerase
VEGQHPEKWVCEDNVAEEARLRSGLSACPPASVRRRTVVRRFIDVGIAVKDLESAVATYSGVLGVTPRMLTHTDYAYPGLKGARFYLGNATLSLVASDDPHSTIAKFIDRRGEGVNHLTFEVSDIADDIPRLAANGVEFLTAHPLDFPEGSVVFAHPRSLHGVQIAFVQPNPGVDLLQPSSVSEKP